MDCRTYLTVALNMFDDPLIRAHRDMYKVCETYIYICLVFYKLLQYFRRPVEACRKSKSYSGSEFETPLN